MSSNDSLAVELRGVSFSYGKRPILEDVNLSLRCGEVTAILGPNGCGKSTTVKLINRQLTPSAGPQRGRPPRGGAGAGRRRGEHAR